MSDWWKKSVVYQIYPKSFNDSNNDGIGDIPGITEKLSYIKKLGASVIWLNPIYKSPYVDNGYDISNYREINPDFGTMADFDNLLCEAHRQKLKIILDLVVNHTSNEHPWFKKSIEVPKNRYRDYYIWKKPVNGHEPNNWGSSFGGSAWEYNEDVGEYYLHLFAKQQPDLNWQNPQVRNEVYKIMRFWLDKGIDGFRMDVINLISKNPKFPNGPVIQNKQYGSYYVGAANGPKVHTYLREMNQKVNSKYNVMTVGETPHTNADEALKYVDDRNKELNMIFHFDHMHLDYGPNGKFSTNRFKLADLKQVLSRWQYKMQDHGWNSLYWSNHDQARAVSRFGDDGKYRVQSAKMLGALLHMMCGTPYIYEGEEIGMTNVAFKNIDDYNDIETKNIFSEFTKVHGFSTKEAMQAIYAKSRDNARTPMQWSTDNNAGFSKNKPWLKVNPNYKQINVKDALQDTDSIFYFYQRLINLRKKHQVIINGKYQLMDEDNGHVFAYSRENENEKLIVICSFSKEKICYSTTQFDSWQLLLSNYKNEQLTENNLLPYECRIYLQRK